MSSNAFPHIVEASTLAITWSDCGGKHATVTDVQPATIDMGSTETVTGTGTVDEDVSAAQVTATISAFGVKLTSCSGDGTKDIECDLPLGAGKIVVKALSYPIKAGTVTIAAEVTSAASLPSSLAKIDAHMTGVDQNGEDLICLDLHTAAEETVAAMPDCSTTACGTLCSCVESKCSSYYSSCAGDSQCNGILTCLLGCSCGDTTCSAACASSAGTLDTISTEVKTCGLGCVIHP